MEPIGSERRPRTLRGQIGYDMAREIFDNARRMQVKGVKFDKIMLHPDVYDQMRTAWAEMAPIEKPFPTVIADVPYMIGDTQGYRYAFLRDYTPWEKKRELENGRCLYGSDEKKIVAGDLN